MLRSMKAGRILCIGLIGCSILLSGCGDSKESGPAIQGGNEIAIMPTTTDGNAQTEVNTVCKTGILMNVDEAAKTVTVRSFDDKEEVVYDYKTGTPIEDRYGKATLIDSIPLGEVVSLEADSSTHKLIKLTIDTGEWQSNNETGFVLDKENRIIKIGNRSYSYTDDLVVMKNGERYSINKVESADVIHVRGRDDSIDSIMVVNGHGYVKLTQTDYFEGGFVDIGTKIVKVITSDMMIPVAPGNYMMTVTKGDVSSQKEIKVEEDVELTVNLLNFQEEAIRYGILKLAVNPSGVAVKIDGRKIDLTQLIQLSYGTHKIVVTKDGYESYRGTIAIENSLTEFSVSLIPESETIEPEGQATTENEDHNDKETQTTTDSQTTGQTTTQRRTSAISNSALQETTTYDSWYSIVSGFLGE